MPIKARTTSAKTDRLSVCTAALLGLMACDPQPEPAGSGPPASSSALASASVSALAEPEAPPIPTYVLSPPPPPSGSAAAAADESAAIAKAVVDYKVAVAKQDGERAAGLVTAGTHTYFETLRKAALSMQESDLHKQPIMDKILILTLRAKVAAEELRKTDGRGLFIYAVKNKMMMGEAQKVNAKAIEQNGDEAWVGVVTDGQKLEPKQGFKVAKESSVWRVDAMSISQHDYVVDLIKKSVPQGEDFDTAWVKFLEEATGKKLPDIWKPADP